MAHIGLAGTAVDVHRKRSPLDARSGQVWGTCEFSGPLAGTGTRRLRGACVEGSLKEGLVLGPTLGLVEALLGSVKPGMGPLLGGSLAQGQRLLQVPRVARLCCRVFSARKGMVV